MSLLWETTRPVFGEASRLLYAGYGLCFVLVLLIVGIQGNPGAPLFGTTAFQYLWTQPEIILHCLSPSVWPSGQCLDYLWPAADFASGLIPALVIVALLGLSARLLLLRNPLGFPGAWFFVILAPSSSLVPLADLAFEHRICLPLAALSVLTITGGYTLLARLFPARGRKPALRAVALGDDSPELHSRLGYLCLVRHDQARAAYHYDRAVELDPGQASSWINLGLARATLGEFDKAGEAQDSGWLSPLRARSCTTTWPAWRPDSGDHPRLCHGWKRPRLWVSPARNGPGGTQPSRLSRISQDSTSGSRTWRPRSGHRAGIEQFPQYMPGRWAALDV